MSSKCGWAVEASRADVASVALLVSVDSHVSLHVGFSAEVLGTDLAQKGPNALVFDLVPHESFPGRELLIALVTGEVEVHGDVIAKATFARESCRAFRTGKRLLTGVNNEVSFQGSRIAEGFGTGVTQKGTLTGMRSEMVFKYETTSKDFAAGRALVNFRFAWLPRTRFFGFVYVSIFRILFVQ